MQTVTFLLPSSPTPRPYLPRGDDWTFEVKFDGYRAQVHIAGKAVTIFSRNGKDMTARFPGVVEAARALPVRSAVIDGELVADGDGQRPDFIKLLRRMPGDHALWAFDALMVNGRDLRTMPYQGRRKRLERLIEPCGAILRLSETFDDGEALLKACAEHGLEGVVAKKIDAPYRAGKTASWVKVKCKSWVRMNEERHRLFNKV